MLGNGQSNEIKHVVLNATSFILFATALSCHVTLTGIRSLGSGKGTKRYLEFYQFQNMGTLTQEGQIDNNGILPIQY